MAKVEEIHVYWTPTVCQMQGVVCWHLHQTSFHFSSGPPGISVVWPHFIAGEEGHWGSEG